VHWFACVAWIDFEVERAAGQKIQANVHSNDCEHILVFLLFNRIDSNICVIRLSV